MKTVETESKYRKYRIPRELNRSVKLTDEQREDIRQRHRSGQSI